MTTNFAPRVNIRIFNQNGTLTVPFEDEVIVISQAVPINPSRYIAFDTNLSKGDFGESGNTEQYIEFNTSLSKADFGEN